MKVILFASIAVLTAAAHAGVGTMTTQPIWDLADHGGARPVSSAKPLEIPNSAIPNVTAFTIQATLRFDELPENRAFTIFDQSVSETGWGLWFMTSRMMGKPLMLRMNGEDYTCSLAFMNVKPGSKHTFTVTAREGWVIIYMDGHVQMSFLMSVTPNLDPIRVGAPRVRGQPLAEIEGVVLEGLEIWGEDEKYWGYGENRNPSLGYKAGKGWLVNVPVCPLKGKPNVFYYGDSISVGYTKPLAELLRGKANLYHWMSFLWKPGAEGVGEKRFEEVCKLADYDYIVFNNGLHSLHWTADKVSDEQIRDSYRGLATAFRRYAPRAKIVYLTTTPHTLKKDAAGVVGGYGEKNGMVLRLNRIAKAVMKDEGIQVVDGYGLLDGQFDLARGDGVHWLDPAYRILAEAVVKAFGL